MRENVYKTFRFTSTTSRQVLVFGAVVPALIGAACYYNDVSRPRCLFPRSCSRLTPFAGHTGLGGQEARGELDGGRDQGIAVGCRLWIQCGVKTRLGAA
jgi:hypothetical protein